MEGSHSVKCTIIAQEIGAEEIGSAKVYFGALFSKSEYI